VSKALRIGIDSYGLDPLGLEPPEILDWAARNGAEGVQFSGLSSERGKGIDASYLRDLAHRASDLGLYLEWGGGQHIPFNTQSWERRDIQAINLRAAKQAAELGTRVIRSCSGGLMRWRKENPKTETLLSETAAALRAQKSMLKDHNVILAIETHFEFTTFELLRLFEMCGTEPGQYLGICLDTMNLMTMLEDPPEAAERLLSWIVCTHIKDGGVILGEEGLVTFPSEIGTGVVDFTKIAALLRSLPYDVHLSIEDHGGDFSIPVFDPLFLAEFPDLDLPEFVRLIGLVRRSQDALQNGSLKITERKDWPAVCEPRMRRNLRNLRAILR
jgi:sugar phosphate isomerase/epimerase